MRCRCGHPKVEHPRPHRLYRWLWSLTGRVVVEAFRPCDGTYARTAWRSKTWCTCPGYRPVEG